MNTPPGEAATPRQAGGAGRRWLRRPAAAGMLVIGFLATGLLVASYSLLHFSPVGIRGAVPSGPEGERAAGRMMSKASSLAAGLDRPGDWGEAFTDAEANAWLSIDLPHHAPGLLEGGISSPQVRFLDRRAGPVRPALRPALGDPRSHRPQRQPPRCRSRFGRPGSGPAPSGHGAAGHRRSGGGGRCGNGNPPSRRRPVTPRAIARPDKDDIRRAVRVPSRGSADHPGGVGAGGNDSESPALTFRRPGHSRPRFARAPLRARSSQPTNKDSV